MKKRKKKKKAAAKRLLEQSRANMARIEELQAQAEELAQESEAAAEERVSAVELAQQEQRQAKAEQLRAQREARALADRLGAQIDPATGMIEPETVTNPFGIYGPKGGKTKLSQGYRGSGKNRVFVITYADGTEDITPAPEFVQDGVDGDGGDGGDGGGDDDTGLVYTAPDGTIFTNINDYNAYIAKTKADEKRQAGQSAYTLLFEQFNQFGLGALVEPLRNLITEGLSQAEFTLRLRDTDAYKKRFAANQQRIARGLRALSEAEYIGLEDQYQDVMRRYGLPETYTRRGDMGRQEGFEKFIAGDVSPVELEDRVQTAQNRILNAPKQIRDALTEFYGGDISNGDILAFVLDPDRALPQIQRKVTAAEIGGAAAMAGLGATRARAEELGTLGVTGQQAREGFSAIAEFLPTAQKLGDIYAKQGMGPFTQTTAEAEVFGTPGAAEAATKRRRLTQLEQAQFAGQVGTTGGALSRERAGSF